MRSPWAESQDPSQIDALSLDRLYDVGQFNQGLVVSPAKWSYIVNRILKRGPPRFLSSAYSIKHEFRYQTCLLGRHFAVGMKVLSQLTLKYSDYIGGPNIITLALLIQSVFLASENK